MVDLNELPLLRRVEAGHVQFEEHRPIVLGHLENICDQFPHVVLPSDWAHLRLDFISLCNCRRRYVSAIGCRTVFDLHNGPGQLLSVEGQ